MTGGISTQPDFLRLFYPEVFNQPSSSGLFCNFQSQRLQLYTSIMFISSATMECAGIPAFLNRYYGRTRLMQISGVCFLMSSVLQTCAQNQIMLLLGRLITGIGLSFATVSVLLYISECAPPQSRGKYNQIFQAQLTFFILLATLLNFAFSKIPFGFRYSLGFSIIPAVLFILFGTFLPDSPSSLIERGRTDDGRRVLQRLRGNSDITVELDDLIRNAEISRTIQSPWKAIIARSYRPQLVLVMLSTVFQQFTGINFIIFYGPQIFLALGLDYKLSLIAAILIAVCNHLSTYVSFFCADIIGRRPLLLQAGLQMSVGLIGIGIALDTIHHPQILAWVIFALVCVFDSSYAWSWGPLGWLYPTEIQSLQTRNAGLSLASLMNVFFSFLFGQAAFSMLCSLKSGLFFFFAGCVIFMTVFVYLAFPETKKIPIEQTQKLFALHQIWKRFTKSNQEKA